MPANHVTDESFKAEVTDYSGYALVDFWATWCGPCKMMAPVVDAMADKHSDKVKVLKIDTDQNPSTAQSAGIVSIPCLILYKNGQEVTRFTGFKPEPALESELLPHLA